MSKVDMNGPRTQTKTLPYLDHQENIKARCICSLESLAVKTKLLVVQPPQICQRLSCSLVEGDDQPLIDLSQHSHYFAVSFQRLYPLYVLESNILKKIVFSQYQKSQEYNV